jgi:putative tryptophan/tyrosine transport system substrate-binding protein
MRRREFITLIGGAAVTWSVVGHAQQRVMPVVGVLCAGTAQALERYLASFREGMRQLGYVEGSNVRFEFRFADVANDLVRLNPCVILSTPLPAHLAARKATSATDDRSGLATGHLPGTSWPRPFVAALVSGQ